jgi:hypothetical protein
MSVETEDIIRKAYKTAENEPRVLTVQFEGIRSSDVAEFRVPKARVVVAPTTYASGALRVFGDMWQNGGGW